MLDVASGTAGVAIQLAHRSAARVVGIDLTEQMLRRGQTTRPLDETLLRAPLARALGAMSWGLMALAAALAVARLR